MQLGISSAPRYDWDKGAHLQLLGSDQSYCSVIHVVIKVVGLKVSYLYKCAVLGINDL